MKVHKLEVATRQFETAIELYLEEGDAFSIVTLCGAAEEVFGVYKNEKWMSKEGRSHNIFNRMYEEASNSNKPYKNPGHFSQALVNREKNSLKHADIEDEAYVAVDESLVDIWMFRTLFNYQMACGEEFTPLMKELEIILREKNVANLEPMA